MADYSPVLTKALEGKGDTGPAARQAVFTRARAALTSQLAVLDPPLSADEIARETQSLEAAIAAVEERYRGQDGAGLGVQDDPPEARRPPAARPAEGPSIRAPRAAVTPLAVLAVLAVVAAPIGLLAWNWRNQPRPPASKPVVAVEEVAPDATSPKLGERLSGARPAPPRSPMPPVASAPPAQAPTAAAPPASVAAASPEAAVPPAELAVAQRAILIEDVPDTSTRKTTVGRALWRLDTVPGGPGQPLETVVRCTIDLSEAGLSLTVTLRRNTDAALPASHLIEIVFAPGAPNRSVREIELPGMRLDEGSRGLPLSGRSVPVKDNLFLVGLSDQRLDVDKNRELLVNRSWLDIPLRFATGAQALILVDKGLSGTRLLNDAFRVWGSAP